jgi:hypothetical protein
MMVGVAAALPHGSGMRPDASRGLLEITSPGFKPGLSRWPALNLPTAAFGKAFDRTAGYDLGGQTLPSTLSWAAAF